MFLIGLDWGVEIWVNNLTAKLCSLKWEEILDVLPKFISSKSRRNRFLIVRLTDGREVKFKDISAFALTDIVQFKRKYYKSLSDKKLLEEYKQINKKITKGVKRS